MLIVDDNSLNIFALQAQLQAFNVDSDIALNGKDAVQLVSDRIQSVFQGIHNKTYKLILLDYSMPQMDGPQTAKAINAEIRRLSNEQSGSLYPQIVCLTAY